jgi:hypothetical protein
VAQDHVAGRPILPAGRCCSLEGPLLLGSRVDRPLLHSLEKTAEGDARVQIYSTMAVARQVFFSFFLIASRERDNDRGHAANMGLGHCITNLLGSMINCAPIQILVAMQYNAK